MVASFQDASPQDIPCKISFIIKVICLMLTCWVGKGMPLTVVASGHLLSGA